MRIDSFFLDHPKSVGETYWQHLRAAMSFAWPLAVAAFCVVVHAIAPALFTRTASGIVSDLNRRMTSGRREARSRA
jgi:hypothetical protein